MSFYLIRPCKSSAAYEAVPKGGLVLDLERAASALEAAGYEVTDAGVLIVAEKELETTVYTTGKMIVKTDSEKDAREEVERIVSLLEDRTS